MAEHPIPATAADMTPAWLTAALRSVDRLGDATSVTAIDLAPIGDVAGVFGTVHRVTPTYEGPLTGDEPTTLVAKFPTDMPDNKAVGVALNFYSKEILALREVAPNTPGLDHARLVYADMDAAEGRFALLIDEVVGRTVGDQLAGATNTQTRAVMSALATLHARWWGDEALSTAEWLPRSDHPVQMAVVPGIMRAAMPILAEQWADRLGAEAIDIGHRVADQYERLLTRAAERARTFAHTDARAVNIFFGDDGVTFIDWQLALWSSPMQDVHYFLSSSITADAWDAWGMDMLRHYHDELVAGGVTDYPWDELWDDFRLFALAGLVAPASTVGTFDTGNELGRKVADSWLERTWRLPVVIGAAAVLE
jgi:hypothetical protein